jgi:hypothetical protein
MLIKKISPHGGGGIHQVAPHALLAGFWPDGIPSFHSITVSAVVTRIYWSDAGKCSGRIME